MISLSRSLSLSLFLSIYLRVRYSAWSGDGGEAAASSLRGCVWAGGLAGMGWDGRVHMAEGGEVQCVHDHLRAQYYAYLICVTY